MMISPATIMLRPAIPLWVVIALLAGCGILAWLTYRRCALDSRRQMALWTMRMAALAVLAWLVLQPERRTVRVEEEASVLAVVVDVSASMADSPGGTGPTRAERVRTLLGDGRFEAVNERYRVRYFEISSGVQELSPERDRIAFDAPRSNIGSGLNAVAQRLRVENVAGVLLLSDGLDYSGESLTAQARAVPVFVPELEEPTAGERPEVADAYIDEVAYPETTVVKWRATIDVLVRRTTKGGAEAFPIHLFREGERLRSSVVSLAGDEAFKRLTFEITPEEVGRQYYYVEIEPTGDARTENNIREFMLDVIDPENRILYLEGPPRWEFKFLKRALLAEKTFRPSAYVRGADGAFVSFGRDNTVSKLELPQFAEEELARQKVLVLGDLAPSAFRDDDLANIRVFVERGGGLLLVGAAQAYGATGWGISSAMRELLPAVPQAGSQMTEGRFSVDFTPAGRTHPALRSLPLHQGLPPVLSVWRPVVVGELSTVLVTTADGSPLVAARRYGQGRVAMVLSDSLWRWQLGSGARVDDKSTYNAFMTQLVHWLSPSEKELQEGSLLQVVTAKSEFELRERVMIGAVYGQGTAKADALTCNIQTPEGRRLPLAMGPTELGGEVGLLEPVPGYSCVFTPHVPGKYQLTVLAPGGTGSATQNILVLRADRERTGRPLDREYLRALTRDTGGKIAPWSKRHDLLKQIPNQVREVQVVEELPIWNRFPWFLLLTALFLGEWWLRRRGDLV